MVASATPAQHPPGPAASATSSAAASLASHPVATRLNVGSRVLLANPLRTRSLESLSLACRLKAASGSLPVLLLKGFRILARDQINNSLVAFTQGVYRVRTPQLHPGM